MTALERERAKVKKLRAELALANKLGNLLFRGLDFYADPASYFAVAVLADRPAGSFADDFSEVDGVQRPGKHARKMMEKCERLVLVKNAPEYKIGKGIR